MSIREFLDALRSTQGQHTLASCTSYDQLLDAARDTIYAPVLRHLRPSRDGALPDFTLAEAALRTAYFSHLYRIVHCQYTGRTQKVLLLFRKPYVLQSTPVSYNSYRPSASI